MREIESNSTAIIRMNLGADTCKVFTQDQAFLDDFQHEQSLLTSPIAILIIEWDLLTFDPISSSARKSLPSSKCSHEDVESMIIFLSQFYDPFDVESRKLLVKSDLLGPWIFLKPHQVAWMHKTFQRDKRQEILF